MNELSFTIQTDEGGIVIPYVQAMSMAQCLNKFKRQGKKAVWHHAACGCCVIVHETTEGHVHEGYLIGEDGGYEWVEEH